MPPAAAANLSGNPLLATFGIRSIVAGTFLLGLPFGRPVGHLVLIRKTNLTPAISALIVDQNGGGEGIALTLPVKRPMS